MRLYRKFAFLLTFSLLVITCIPEKVNSETVIIQNVELLRRGKQISVKLITSSPPAYQITENLAAKTLVVKFQKASAGFSDGRMERLFNDPQLSGIRFSEFESEIWAQFKLEKKDLTYSVSALNENSGVQIDFRPTFEIEPLPDPPQDAVYQLSSLEFDTTNKSFTRLILDFSKPDKLSTSSLVLEDKGPPRIFLLEDSRQTQLTIRLPNTLPKKELEKLEFKGKRMELETLKAESNQTFIKLNLKLKDIKVERHFVSAPPRWTLDIQGTSIKEKIVKEALEEEKLSAVELAKIEEEKKARRKRAANINLEYKRGETAFRNRLYDKSVSHFRKAYSIGKENTAEEFGDPLHPRAAKALFRIGDTIYTMLERRIGDNYHQAIQAYKTAIRVTNDAQKNANDNGEDFGPVSQLPHAHFRIGRAYQKMKFHHEATIFFNILQESYPNSMEAMEASFWKGMSRIDQRQWETAITDFQEYLRSAPKPKFYSVTHYKMAQANYRLKRYITAREFFDIARSSDKLYASDDPTLMFHMGETYYENAEYVTAREIFKELLKKYPKADFSKLVAIRLGDFLRDEGKEDEAIQAYQNAISSYSREIALVGKLRIANIQAKRPYSDEYLEAIKVYEEIPILYPETPQAEEALLRKGLTLTQYGLFTSAINSLEEFMQEYPQNIFVKKNLIQENIDENLKGLIDGHFRERDNFAIVSAYNDYKSKYLFNFRFDTTLFQTAVAHRGLGFYEEALDILNFLETRSEGTIGELVQLEKAMTLQQSNRLVDARDTLARFLQQYPDSPYDAEARQLLARIYRHLKSYSLALLVYSQTLQKYDRNSKPLQAEIVPELFFELGEMHEETGKFVDAGEAFMQAVSSYNHPINHQETPEYIVKSHFLSPEMHLKAQNYDIALESYKHAIEIYGKTENEEIMEQVFWARYQTGVINTSKGDEKQALKIYTELMELPGHEEKLWKKLAAENHRTIQRKLTYNDYLKE